MNLSEALDAALPEIPKTRLARSRPPRLDPDLVIRHDTMDGEPFVGILQRGKNNFFRFEPAQWQIAQLFDGVRSFEEIAQLYSEQTGFEITTCDVELFSASLDESDFWYKTPQEKNIAYSARLKAQRDRKAKRKSKVNIAHISFSAWDPDTYLTWLDKAIGRFIYSKWAFLSVVILFGFEGFVFVARWNVLGPDIPLYYNFTHKSFADFVEFWLLLFGLGFIHESAHGLTCKHYGGEVHNMGLMLLYLTPAFFVDVTETWVSATRVQRLATIIAGIWIEMVFCGLAMLVWTNTPPGIFIHDLAYKVILITGLAVIVMNLNPLLKLDGYYFLTEFIGIPDLKERSTAFVSTWFQKKLLRLPVDIVSIPRRRVPLFTTYALVSGAYSYLVLFAFIQFAYNLTSKLLAEFALLPVGWLAFTIFRSRLKALRGVVRQVWQNHGYSSHSGGWSRLLRPLPLLTTAALLVLFFVPILRIREDAYFLVDPPNRVTLHAAIAGQVDAVFVAEGQHVHAGQPLLHMTSLDAASLAASADAAAGVSRYSAFEAQMRGQSIGSAAASQEAALHSGALAREAQASLWVTAARDGIVLDADPGALLHQQVGAGQTLLTLSGEIQATDSGPVSATRSGSAQLVRVFIPAGALNRIPPGAEVALAPPGVFTVVRTRLGPVDGAAVPLPPGIAPRQEYKGIELPAFYTARLTLLPGAPRLPLGSAGQAKVFGLRRSVASRCLSVVLNLIHAHVW